MGKWALSKWLFVKWGEFSKGLKLGKMSLRTKFSAVFLFQTKNLSFDLIFDEEGYNFIQESL